MSAMEPIIRLEGVKKVFYTEDVETHAVSDLSLSINKGEYVSITGPSGCGKSTCLSILGLLDSPTAGKYWLNDQDVSDLSISERSRIRNREVGFVFQNYNLVGDRTVADNVALPLMFRGMKKAERDKRVSEALERVGGMPNVEVMRELQPLPKIFADREQIQSVVTNLVLNAREALGPRGRN